MFRTLVLGTLLLAMPIPSHVQPQTGPAPLRSVTVKVEASAGWQDSGVELRVGQRYSVTAFGHWVSGSGEPVGPEGGGTGTITSDALVGMIGRARPDRLGYDSYKPEIVSRVILIGEGGKFLTLTNGKLWLAMGDWSGCKQCRGTIEVQIIIYN